MAKNKPSTIIIGPVQEIINGLNIILYDNKILKDTNYEQITKFNINSVLDAVKNNGKYLRLERESSDDYYEYLYNNGSTSGFNVVVYLKNSDNSPIGYTEFQSLQGENRNINIYTDFTTATTLSTTNSLNNSLVEFYERDNTKDFIGEKLNEYTSSSKISINPKEKYTSHVLDISKNKVINLNYGIAQESGISKLGIIKEFNPDPYKLNFTNYIITHYADDICVAEFTRNFDITKKKYFNAPGYETNLGKEDIFNITSLGKFNKFEKPISYIKALSQDHNYQGACRVPDYGDYTYQSIISICGKFVLVKVYGIDRKSEDDEISDEFIYKIFNVETLEYLDTPDTAKFIFNEWSINPRAIYYDSSNSLSYFDLVKLCPDVINVYEDIKTLMSQRKIEIYKRIGDWFIIKYTKQGKIIYLCTSSSNSIYFTEDDGIDNIIPINNNSILLKKDDSYTIYSGYGVTYGSENYRNFNEGGNIETFEKIKINISGTDSDNIYKNYYKNGDIQYCPRDKELFDSPLNNYRRNYYPYEITNTGLPDIIGACDGLIYYKNNNKINYL